MTQYKRAHSSITLHLPVPQIAPKVRGYLVLDKHKHEHCGGRMVGPFNRAPDFGSQKWRWNQDYWTESGVFGIIFLLTKCPIHIYQ